MNAGITVSAATALTAESMRRGMLGCSWRRMSAEEWMMSGKKTPSGMWSITSAAGVALGTYAGDSVADALDAMARDAGYASQEAASSVVGLFDGHVVYVGRSEPPPEHDTLVDELAFRECEL